MALMFLFGDGSVSRAMLCGRYNFWKQSCPRPYTTASRHTYFFHRRGLALRGLTEKNEEAIENKSGLEGLRRRK